MKHVKKGKHNQRRERLFRLVVRNNRRFYSYEKEKSSSRIVIYQSEFEYMARCILDKNNIETGGQLFGHWTNEGTPIILYVIGPGPQANHQSSFFNQDIDYLVKVGGSLRSRFGLHHIGEWHSHHQLGLDRPSIYDVNTMTSVIRGKGLGHFLLCIGTCTPDEASVRGFMCNDSNCQSADWDVIRVDSPVRKEVDQALSEILIHPAYPSKSI